MGLESAIRSRRESRNPWSSTIWALMSCSFATQTAAVFRTYGSSSFRHLRRGSHKYSVILSTLMHPIVRTARARMRGFGSSQSCKGTEHAVNKSASLTTDIFRLFLFQTKSTFSDYVLKKRAIISDQGIKGGTHWFTETFYIISRCFQATTACKIARL